MSSLAPLLWTVAALDVIYLVTLQRASVADAVAGALFGILFLWWFHPHLWAATAAGTPARLRVGRVAALAVVSVGRGFAGAWAALASSLSGCPARGSGIVEVPLGELRDRAVAIAALLDSVSPGSVAVEVDDDRRVLVAHVLKADEGAVRSRQRLLAQLDGAFER